MIFCSTWGGFIIKSVGQLLFQTAKSASSWTTRGSKNIYRRLLCSFSRRDGLEINQCPLSSFSLQRFARIRPRPWPHTHVRNVITSSCHRHVFILASANRRTKRERERREKRVRCIYVRHDQLHEMHVHDPAAVVALVRATKLSDWQWRHPWGSLWSFVVMVRWIQGLKARLERVHKWTKLCAFSNNPY